MNKNFSFLRVSHIAALVLGIAASGVFTPQKLAAQLFWDQNGGTSGTGGTGNWDLSSSFWRSGSATGTLGLWSAGNSAVLGGTAGTVTLNTTGISATGLDFQTTGYTVAGTTTNILTLTGTSPIINVVSAGTATFSTGRLEGTSGFTKTGAGSLVIQSASGISGAVNVNAGTLSLGTANGTLTSATSVTVAQGATLQLNNTASNNNNNRLGNIDVTLNGGTLNFVGLQAASGTNESINRIVLGSGASTLSLANSAGSGAQLGTLTLANATSGISRSTGATLNFVDDANGDIVSTNLATSNNIIGGWAVFTGTTASWLKSVSGSLRTYGSGDTGYQNASDSTTWLTSGNIDATGARTTVGRTINSLNITGSGTARAVTVSSGTLVLASGGLMATGTTGHSLNGGTITAGTVAGAELFVYNNLGFSIDSIIGNNAGGTVNFVKSGAGTLTLSGATANTFSGISYINEGTVTMSKTAGVNALGGNVIINGGTLGYGSNDNQIGDSATVTLNFGNYSLGARAETIGALTMTGGTLSRGGATLTLAGASSITAGTLNFTANASSRISTSSTLALGGATFSYDNASNTSTGTLTLGGNVTYAASNTAATIFSNSLAGVGRLELGSGTRTFDIADSTNLLPENPEVSINWTVTGTADLAKSGTGTLLLLQSNSYTGKTTITGGFIASSGEGRFGANPVTFVADQITLNGGGIQSNGGSLNFSSNRGITLGAGGGTFDTSGGNVTLTNVVTGSGTLTKSGTGTLIASGVHTYNGATNIQQDTLQLSTGDNRLPTTTTVSLGQAASTNLGTLDLNGRNQQVAGLSSVTGANATANNNTITSATAATLTLGGSGSYSYGDGTNANSGVITGAIALLKSGIGTQTLGDFNTYSGGTTLSAGTLNITNTTGSATGTGNVLIQDAATLQGSGRIVPTTGGTIIVEDGGTVAIGDLNATPAQGAKILTFTPASGTITTTFQTGSTIRFDLFTNDGDNTAIPAAADIFRTGGNLTFQNGVILSVNKSGSFSFADGNKWLLLDWTSLSGSITGTTSELTLELPTLDPGLFWDVSSLYTNGSIAVMIPEPSRTLFLALGLLTLTLRRRR